MATNIKSALDLCKASKGSLMPVSKLKTFVDDAVQPSKFPGYQTGLYRINALSNGKILVLCCIGISGGQENNYREECGQWYTTLRGVRT